MRWAACAVVVVAFGGFGVSSAVGAVGVDVVFANPDYITFGVDPDGVGYGVLTDSSNPVQKYRLYRTLDEGRTWAPLHDFPTNSHVKGLSVLPSGTLLAHLVYDDEYLYRSSDGGQTWTPVLHYPLLYGVLTAHSVTSDGTYAYVVSYNNFSGDGPFTNWVWRSADDGQTWSIVYTTSAYRHGHAVQVNPYTGDVYVLWGDKEDVAAIERSTDHGQTWHKVCTTVLCVGVDIAFSPQGFAVFGRDSPFGPGAIQRLDLASGVSTTVASMAGTSFSAFRHQGVFLIGNTHEPQANYPANDPNLHLYASADEGLTFNDVFQIPWQYPNGYIELRVQYAYPSGDFPIQVTGYGTIVAKLTGVGSSPSVPANTALPAVSGTAQVGQTLSGSTGSWSNSPTSYARQWTRCNSSGSSCVDINGATAASYLLVAADQGSTIRVRVTASNAAGPGAPATSAQTAVVAAAGGGGGGGSFGATAAGSLSGAPGAGYKFGSAYPLAAAATATTFEFYARGGSTAQSFTPAIYTSTGSSARHPRRDRTNRHRGRKPTSRLGQLHPPPDPPPGRQLLPRPHLRPRRQPSLHLLQHRHPNRRRLQHKPRRHPHPNLRQPRHRTTQMELPDPTHRRHTPNPTHKHHAPHHLRHNSPGPNTDRHQRHLVRQPNLLHPPMAPLQHQRHSLHGHRLRNHRPPISCKQQTSAPPSGSASPPPTPPAPAHPPTPPKPPSSQPHHRPCRPTRRCRPSRGPRRSARRCRDRPGAGRTAPPRMRGSGHAATAAAAAVSTSAGQLQRRICSSQPTRDPRSECG